MELDCSSVGSALQSVSAILGKDQQSLTAMLRNAQPSSAELKEQPFDEVVIGAVSRECGDLPRPDSVIWFHASRVLREARFFEEGLLPINAIRQTIESELCEIAVKRGLCTAEQWPRLPREGHEAHRLRAKLGTGSFDKGPHGFLVRETILDRTRRPALSIADYTLSSEVASEMCGSLDPGVGSLILSEYNRERVPVVVKFRSRRHTWRTLETALMYLHGEVNGYSLNDWSTRGFDGEGITIPPHDILGVETLSGDPF